MTVRFPRRGKHLVVSSGAPSVKGFINKNSGKKGLAMQVRFGQLQQAVIARGYTFFDAGDYNLNVIGVRNTQDVHANTFNDRLCVAFRVDTRPMLFSFPCTTDPGVFYRENPANVNGTAILPTGQHFGLWQVGKHQGRYDALVQRAPVTVIRDRNADNALDFHGNNETGLFGINCHRAAEQGTSVQVDRWSAGCQVLANAEDFDVLMALAKKAITLWGNGFTYTLLEDVDLG